MKQGPNKPFEMMAWGYQVENCSKKKKNCRGTRWNKKYYSLTQIYFSDRCRLHMVPARWQRCRNGRPERRCENWRTRFTSALVIIFVKKFLTSLDVQFSMHHCNDWHRGRLHNHFCWVFNRHLVCVWFQSVFRLQHACYFQWFGS